MSQANFITDKRIVLASPGFALNNLYYSNMNSTVEPVETTYNIGRFSSSLTNSQFRSQSTVVITKGSQLRNLYLHLELPAIAAADQTICRLWGYKAVKNISYLFGSANVSQIQVNSQSHLQSIMIAAATEEKRSELARIGGEEHLLPTSGTIHASVLLDLPWSTSAIGKKGVDTNILDSQITISIELASAAEMYGGNLALAPTAFLDATIRTAQGNLFNKANSLNTALTQNPTERYNYPFIHKQSFTKSNISGIGFQTIDLLSFINADLLAISIGIVKTSFLSSLGSTQSPSPFNYNVGITDFRLLNNGLVMYDSKDIDYKLFNMADEAGASFFQNSVISDGAVSPFSSDPVDTYIVTIDFSMMPSYSFTGNFFNTFRIANNTMQLTFNLPDGDVYTLFATYYYNAIASINKNVNIFFD